MNTNTKANQTAADAPEAPRFCYCKVISAKTSIAAYYGHARSFLPYGHLPSTCRKATAPEAPQHSPLPWKAIIAQENIIFGKRSVRIAITDANRIDVATTSGIGRDTDDEENAKLIVRAVNNAEGLAEALRRVQLCDAFKTLPIAVCNVVNDALAKWEAEAPL
jgi:hypothetical protein